MSHYLSIDVGGTFVKFAIINGAGQIQEKDKVRTPHEKKLFLNMIDEIIEKYLPQIDAVTMSCPGKVDTKNGVIHYGGALEFLDGLTMKAYVETTWNIPFSVLNDGKAAALAELWLGELKEVQNGIALTLGTGIGGGLILNKQLFEGSHFQAGEISFGVDAYDATGIKTVVAQRGSAVGFITEASAILELENPLDGITVFEELEKNNPLVYPLFQSFCRQIAVVIINIQSVLDMEKVAIGGGISVQPLLIQEIKAQYQLLRNSLPLMSESLVEVAIVPCHFKNEANLLGALYHYLVSIENEV